MGARAEICWNRRNEEGEKLQVSAHRSGNEWEFFIRHKRFDQWQPFSDPILEDWLELLDGLERRAQRKIHRPEEIDRIRKTIRERFPGTDLP